MVPNRKQQRVVVVVVVVVEPKILCVAVCGVNLPLKFKYYKYAHFFYCM